MSRLKLSIVFILVFPNNIIASSFIFFFIVDLYFFIPAVIRQVCFFFLQWNLQDNESMFVTVLQIMENYEKGELNYKIHN